MTDIEDTESAKYENDNDQQMLHRLDGPFATLEMVEEAVKHGLEMTPPMVLKRYSANEPYTPLVAVPSIERPERYVALADAPPPEEAKP
jgi:hypothetical protein